MRELYRDVLMLMMFTIILIMFFITIGRHNAIKTELREIGTELDSEAGKAKTLDDLEFSMNKTQVRLLLVIARNL